MGFPLNKKLIILHNALTDTGHGQQMTDSAIYDKQYNTIFV